MFPSSIFSYWTSSLEGLLGVEILEWNGILGSGQFLMVQTSFPDISSVIIQRYSAWQASLHTQGRTWFNYKRKVFPERKLKARQLVVSVTEPANELYNTWPLGQTQVPSSDVDRFINNAKEKKKKNAAEVFCDDLRRRKIYTADWLASWWDWSSISNGSSGTGEKAWLLNK